jgi:hypothetical protein
MWMCETGTTVQEDLTLFWDCLINLAPTTSSLSNWLTTLSTLAIAYFAFAQLNTIKQQTKIALLNKRLSCYVAYEKSMQHIRSSAGKKIDSELLIDLQQACREARFLFEKSDFERLDSFLSLLVKYNFCFDGYGCIIDYDKHREILEEVDRLYSMRETHFVKYLSFDRGGFSK